MTQPLLRALEISLDNLPYGTYVKNRAGQVVYIKSQLLKLTKTAKTEQFQQNFESLIHENDRQAYCLKWQNCLEYEREFKADYLLFYKDQKEYRRVQEVVTAVKDANKQVCYWLSTINDVHTHKVGIEHKDNLQLKLESAHKEVSDFKYALDQSSIVAVTDSRGVITYVNDKFCEISKYSYSELIGKTHKVINSDYHTNEFFSQLWETISSGRVWEGEIKNKAKDGSEYWVSTFIVPFLDEDNKPFQYIAIRTDITSRKIVEAERLRLEASEKAALEASHLKSQFLANMSHEIRTPLNGIIGMTKILNDSDLSVTQREYAQTILDSANHLSLIVNDILDLAKIESGKMHLEVTGFDLDEMVSGVDRSLRHQANAKGINFRVSITKETGSLFSGDFLRIRQILLNLTHNAVKFTDQGDVHLKVSTSKKESLTWINFSIQDTGIGMTQETIAAIFNPFVQADSSTTRRYGGTGLGLSICKKLADLMGGVLSVVSVPGKGSTFEFSVPLVEINEFTEAQPDIKSTLSLGERKKLSILVAEDHPTNQKVISKILQTFGCQFKVVSDGYEACRDLERNSYDLILMDCHMPNCDGFSAAQIIRENGNQTPIVALTADVMKGTKERCIAAGMHSHISKPIDPLLLYAEIEKIIKPHADVDVTLEPSQEEVVKVLDLMIINRLEILCKGPEDDFIGELITDFVNKTPAKIQSLAEFLNAKKSEDSFKLSHNLKTVAGTLGLVAFSKCCESIEKMSRLDEIVEARLEVEKLPALFEESRQRLNVFRAQRLRSQKIT